MPPTVTLRGTPSAARRQTGIGLLEVLLAVVLMSIGFLAAASLQVRSMATSQNAYALSQAKYMVLDMAERMRANREGLRAGVYDGLTTTANTSAPACVDGTTPCSPAEIAAADRHAFSLHLHPEVAGVAALLPSIGSIDAGGSVALNAATGAYDVRVQWAERLEGNDAMRSVSVQVIPATLN